MKQLTWLAAEQRHCTDGDSEEEHSPTSPGSQEEEEEDDEEGPKGQEEEVEEERSSKETGEGLLSAEGPPEGAGRCSARGRGQRPSIASFGSTLLICSHWDCETCLSLQGGADPCVACGGVGKSATARMPPSSSCCTTTTSWTTTRSERARTWPSLRATSGG